MTVRTTTAVRRAARRLEVARLALRTAVAEARADGATWSQIAHALNISIGAVRHRYGSPSVPRPTLDSATPGATILPAAPDAVATCKRRSGAADIAAELARDVSQVVSSCVRRLAFVFVLDVEAGRKPRPGFVLLDGGFEDLTKLVDSLEGSKLRDRLVENLSDALPGDSELDRQEL